MHYYKFPLLVSNFNAVLGLKLLAVKLSLTGRLH